MKESFLARVLSGPRRLFRGSPAEWRVTGCNFATPRCAGSFL